MKKLFFFAMLAAGMTAACQKPAVEVVDSDEPVAIQFGMKAPTVSVTKTKAAIDDWQTSMKIHVVGYNLNNNTDFLFAETGTPEIQGGEVAKLGFSDKYYDVNYAYDFRAYYLGDDATHQGKTLSVSFEITGQEDIMAGITNRGDDIKNATDPNKPVTDAQMYSAFAARRGVHPSLTFQHMLTRLEVMVEYANRTAGNENLQVNLENLTVNSRTTGTLSLTDEPKVTFDGETGKCDVAIDGATNTGTVMIQPGLSEITLNFDLTSTQAGASQPNQSITIKATDVKASGTDTSAGANVFEAGKKYVVKIKVYDLEDIEVTATLTDWVDGGEVTYDPDDNNWTPKK